MKAPYIVYTTLIGLALFGMWGFLAQASANQKVEFERAIYALQAGELEIAKELFTNLAKDGMADAQVVLGEMYGAGMGFPQDRKMAVEWYRKAAKQGHSYGQCQLGISYMNGSGVKQNTEEALRWLEKSAEQDEVCALFFLGNIYGGFHHLGPKDTKAAFKWWLRAAELGHMQSQAVVSLFYEKGYVVPKDYEKAADWCRKSAEQGWAPALEKLASMYAEGRGVKQNNISAYKWLMVLKALESEDSHTVTVEEQMQSIGENMTPEQIQEAINQADIWVNNFQKQFQYQ